MKIIPINEPDKKKLSLAECKKILNKNGNDYTDEEVELIRAFIYQIADIVIENHKNKTNEKEELHTLRQSEYRRAS